MIICSAGRTIQKVYKNILQNSLISESGRCNHETIEPQRCKNLCGSLIYGVYLLRHSGARCFSSFHTAPAICRTRDVAHNQGREVAPLMRHRTPRTSQRCVPAGTCPQTTLPEFQHVTVIVHGDSSFRRQHRNEGQNRQLPPGREAANAHAVGDAGAPTGSLRTYAA